MVVFVLVTWPGLLRFSEDAAQHNKLATAFEQRFRPIANVSLVILLVTGMLQMSGDPNYEGLFKFGNVWSIGLFAKHIAFGGMLVVTGVLQFTIEPALRRANMAADHKPEMLEEVHKQRMRAQQLTMVNLVLGVVVLLLTAYITAL